MLQVKVDGQAELETVRPKEEHTVKSDSQALQRSENWEGRWCGGHSLS